MLFFLLQFSAVQLQVGWQGQLDPRHQGPTRDADPRRPAWAGMLQHPHLILLSEQEVGAVAASLLHTCPSFGHVCPGHI